MPHSPTQSFDLEKRGDVTVARLNAPKLDLDARESLYGLIENQGIRKLVLNFELVKVLTSAPIGMLINLMRKAEAAGGSVRFSNVGGDIREILRLTAVVSLFPIFPTEQDAIDSFQRS